MKYDDFRKLWFENLSEEAQKDRKSYFALDVELELEMMCREDYNRMINEIK